MAAAEPPPMPLKIATICGMSVIGTRLPQTQNTNDSAIASTIRPRLSGSMPWLPQVAGAKKVTTVAMTMPMPAHLMPRLAVTGEPICMRPTMNNRAAAK